MGVNIYFYHFVFALTQFLPTILASSQCKDGSSCSDSTYCCLNQGTYSCCRWRSMENPYPFWTHWYLWVAFAAFFLVILSCLVAYRRRQRARMQLARNANSMGIPIPSHPRQSRTSNVHTQQGRNPAVDAPPTYEQITKDNGPYVFYSKNQGAMPDANPIFISAPPYSAQPPPITTQLSDPPAPPYPGN